VIVAVHTHRSLYLLIAQARQSLVTLNVYERESMDDNPLLATRFYLILFTFSLIIVSIFTGIQQQTHSFTVQSPTEIQFTYLHAQYSAKLSCPCSQIAIQYKKFLTISSVYHQVCSSLFVSSNWSTAMLNKGNPWTAPDWLLLSAHFRLLSSMCELADNAIVQSTSEFMFTELISVETMHRQLFESQVNSAIDIYIEQIPAIFRRTLAFISEAFRSNQLEHQYSTNWDVILTNLTENVIFHTVPVFYNNGTCAAGMSTCSRLLSFKDTKNNSINFPSK